MTVLADLHTHSTASDGQYAPAALVEKGCRRRHPGAGGHRPRHH